MCINININGSWHPWPDLSLLGHVCSNFTTCATWELAGMATSNSWAWLHATERPETHRQGPGMSLCFGCVLPVGLSGLFD